MSFAFPSCPQKTGRPNRERKAYSHSGACRPRCSLIFGTTFLAIRSLARRHHLFIYGQLARNEANPIMPYKLFFLLSHTGCFRYSMTMIFFFACTEIKSSFSFLFRDHFNQQSMISFSLFTQPNGHFPSRCRSFLIGIQSFWP